MTDVADGIVDFHNCERLHCKLANLPLNVFERELAHEQLIDLSEIIGPLQSTSNVPRLQDGDQSEFSSRVLVLLHRFKDSSFTCSSKRCSSSKSSFFK